MNNNEKDFGAQVNSRRVWSNLTQECIKLSLRSHLKEYPNLIATVMILTQNPYRSKKLFPSLGQAGKAQLPVEMVDARL